MKEHNNNGQRTVGAVKSSNNKQVSSKERRFKKQV